MEETYNMGRSEAEKGLEGFLEKLRAAGVLQEYLF